MAAGAGTVVAPAKAGDRIYETIKSELYIELAPGDRLTEQSVSRRFGVSRIPVREALHRLVQEGYLHAHRRAGYTVREIGQR
ncbi:MAG: winged helix-turn-helix domain-containing protein, partial [Ectothiorhodospiraceae bacterium]